MVAFFEAPEKARMEIFAEKNGTTALERLALQNFTVSNRELTELEILATRFNIFEALGVVRDERKHSSFLGFLLNPRGTHKLRDRFLKRVLQVALEIEPSVATLTPLDIELLDLSNAEVGIERNGIDVFIHDARSHLCVILENKVDTTEHSDQLGRYHRLISQRYPEATTVFGIYLTLGGELPEKEEDCGHYAPVSHSTIRGLLDRLFTEPDLQIENSVRFAIDQYREVLGRHFMADEQIKKLCEDIYKKHKQAIDLIFSNLPNRRAATRERLIELIQANNSLTPDVSTAAYVRFIPTAFDIPYFGGGWGWTPSTRFLLFEFQITQKSVTLVLQMGPGDTERREQIHQLALDNKEIFQVVEARLYPKWQSLYRKSVVEGLDTPIDDDQFFQTIETNWNRFLEDDLPRIEQVFMAHQWPILAQKV